MSGKVADLLNFTSDESPVRNSGQHPDTKKKSFSDNLLFLDHGLGTIGDGRKSLDNNPFDRVSKQVETFSADPFEFVSDQSKNFKPELSCIRTGNLLGLDDESFLIDKENNNNGGNNSEVRQFSLLLCNIYCK